jgi:protein-S-isoprenylcysteine O-methyltransferase Ste14
LFGIALVVIGVGLFLWAIRTFATARTGIMPARSASCVVMAGPYRISRNPMYVSFTAIYIGLALALALPWAFVLLPGVLVALIGMVIHREERYMQGTFGTAYEEYCRRVPRWL